MIFRKLKEITGHSASIYTLDFFQNFIYSGGADSFVARWKLHEGVQDNFSIRFGNSVYAIQLFDDHRKLAVGLSNGDLHFFDLHNRTELKFYKQHLKAIFCIAENTHSKQLYVSDADGNLSVWDTQSFELLAFLPFACGKIRRIAVNPDGSRLALAAQDGHVRVLDSNTLNLIADFELHREGAMAVLFHPVNSAVLFTGGKDAHLIKWDLISGERLKAIPAHNFAIYDLMSLGNGEILVSASRDKTIKIWNLETLEITQRLDIKLGGHRHSVNSLAKLDENSFCSASDDRKIILWKMNVD